METGYFPLGLLHALRGSSTGSIILFLFMYLTEFYVCRIISRKHWTKVWISTQICYKFMPLIMQSFSYAIVINYLIFMSIFWGVTLLDDLSNVVK